MSRCPFFDAAVSEQFRSTCLPTDERNNSSSRSVTGTRSDLDGRGSCPPVRTHPHFVSLRRDGPLGFSRTLSTGRTDFLLRRPFSLSLNGPTNFQLQYPLVSLLCFLSFYLWEVLSLSKVNGNHLFSHKYKSVPKKIKWSNVEFGPTRLCDAMPPVPTLSLSYESLPFVFVFRPTGKHDLQS